MQTLGFSVCDATGERCDEARIEPAGHGELLGVVRDITDRRRAETAMRQALTVFEVSSQGIMTTDAGGRISSVNPAFCAMSGFAATALVGTHWSIFDPECHDADGIGLVRAELDAEDRWQGKVWSRRANGQRYPVWLNISVLRNARGEIAEFILHANDITLREQQEEAIWRQANFDALTGLANRNLLQDRLERAIAEARRNGPGRPDLSRSRRLQGDQRHARSRRRRCPAGRGGTAPAGRCARTRHGGVPRR